MAELLARLASMAQRSLVLWGHSPAATAKLINLSENATYRVDDPASGGPSIRIVSGSGKGVSGRT